MKLFLDFFPLVVFVGVYFYSGAEHPMYPAVQGLIIAVFIQTIGTRLLTGKFEKMHLWILLVTVVLGGMTLVFRDPLFVQWKASVVAWLTAGIFLYRQLVSKKPIIQDMMHSALSEEDQSINVPDSVWKGINFSWPIGYFIYGFLNLYIAFNFSEAFWVKFKLIGFLVMTLGLLVFTVLRLYPYLPKESDKTDPVAPNSSTDAINSADKD